MSYQRTKIKEINPQAILWDGLDNCIIGITEEACAVYDIHSMEKELMAQNDWDWETAAEYVEFNILRAYGGEFTPIHVWMMPPNE